MRLYTNKKNVSIAIPFFKKKTEYRYFLILCLGSAVKKQILWQKPQSLCHNHDKILDIGDDSGGCQAAPV